ncbi:IS30 family transposase, partial [Atopobacter sp. AH10]|uniref:IS30 family transposase n=1 Tax=Atopobacter sp. AH10 TaxID=2315861 RepID=UPI000EF1905A
CGRPPKWHQLADFLDWADERMQKDHWSPEAVIGYAKKEELFSECDLPCVTTLYEWINHGITRTKNINLLEKTSRKPSGRRSRIRKRSSLGTSIEERPKSIETREEFGHWEIDTVIGAKDATDDVLLTLVERQTRFEYLIRIPAKTSCAVQEAVNQLLENAGEDAKYLFKSITTDNGKEFTHLEDAFKEYLAVYYCHPYSSWERGSSENQHRLIRRFIPKGTRMDSVSDRQLKRIQRWMNDYPRKSLHFNTAHDLLVKAFERERNAA